MNLAELARELDTYGGSVRYRQMEGEEAADAMNAEFISRSLSALDLDSNTDPENVQIVTKNSFFVVMKRKT